MNENNSDFDILIKIIKVLETDYTFYRTFRVILMKLNYMI